MKSSKPKTALLGAGTFQVVADGVSNSPNGSGTTGDDKLKEAFPHLHGEWRE